MKTKTILPVTLIVSGLITGAFTFTDVLPIGSDLPKGNVAMKDVTGKYVSMKDAQKKNGLLVMFTCNTCPFVIKNQQRTRAVCRFALQNDIGVILLNSNESQRDDDDSFDAMQKYARQQGYDWYYVVDKDNVIADGFGAKRTPECFLFNGDLKLSYHGAIDDNPGDEGSVTQPYLRDAINAVLSGKDVAVKESRSVGCGIKRKEK